MGRSIPEGAKDGFRAPVAFRVAGLPYHAGDYLARTRVVVPSIAEADGRGTARLYGFHDLVALRVVAELRRERLCLRRIRRCVEVLRRYGPKIGRLSETCLLTDGHDAHLALNPRAVVALLDSSRQFTCRALVDIGRVAEEVRKSISQERGNP